MGITPESMNVGVRIGPALWVCRGSAGLGSVLARAASRLWSWIDWDECGRVPARRSLAFTGSGEGAAAAEPASCRERTPALHRKGSPSAKEL